ncbi:MAG: ABC transporter permease [Saccharofermentanales bacterium]|jgi:simple sugar transport system permease protein|nr:ABC transporter permease [Bacillota bacterium]NLB08553.1 ABC transporter permease [Clostridiales bacterium]
MVRIADIFQSVLTYAIPLMVVALAGMFSERSGVINISLEGTMIMGAFTGILFIHTMQRTDLLSGHLLLLTGLLISMVTGIIYSSLHAIAAINMFADQTISGTALNIFAPAFAVFVARSIIGVQQIPLGNVFRIAKVPGLAEIPILGPLFFENAYLTTYIGIAILIISQIVLSKTRFGLRLKSAGEYPQATDAAGVSVVKMRYAGVLISGALAGLGGLIYVVPISTEFSPDVAGYGFLAIAVMIFGQWKPLYIAAAAFFFGALKTISFSYSSLPVIKDWNIPGIVYKVLPYVITIVVLFLTSRKSAAPSALGEPFDKGKR